MPLIGLRLHRRPRGQPELAPLALTALCLALTATPSALRAQLTVPASDPLKSSSSVLPNPLGSPDVPFGPNNDQLTPAPDAMPADENSAFTPPDQTQLKPLPPATAAPVDASTPDSDDPALLPLVEQPYPEPGQPLPPSEATIDKVLEIAATDSTTMREQAQLVAANDAERYRSWVKYLPAIDAKYNVGFFDLIRGDIQNGQESSFGGAYTIEASRPLYYWGAVEATEKLALLKEQIAQTQAITAYAKLCIDLRKQYYELIAQKARVTLLAREAESAARHVDTERQLLAAGKGVPVKVTRDDLQYRNLELQQATAQNTFEFNVGEFRRLSGALDFDQKDVPDYIVMPRIDIVKLRAQFDGFRKRGFFDSSVSKTASLEQDAIDNQIIINDANQKPTFNIGVGVTQGPYEDTSTKTGGIYFQTIIFAGITGTWHLFDNDTTSDNTRSLLAERRFVNAELAGTRDQLFSRAGNELNLMEISLRGIAMLKEQLANLQNDYREEKQRLALGQSSQADVDSIRDGILQVKFDILQYQTNVVAGYYGFMTSIFCDPAMNNVDVYNHTPSP
jgi:outer membrane protein TolC